MTISFKYSFLASVLSLSLSVVGLCLDTPKDDPPSKADLQALQPLADQNSQFAWELYGQLRGTQGNVFISPYSISTALAMTATGARSNTLDEMSKVLHLSGKPDQFNAQFELLQRSLMNATKHYELRIANALWGQQNYPFLPEYMNNVQKHYLAQARTLDFGKSEESRQIINQWVEEQTNQKIRELIPAGIITSATKLVLTNAIYFKGKWQDAFDKAQTAPADFHLSSDAAIKAAMMIKFHRYYYASSNDVRVLDIPYQGNRLSLTVVLPVKKHGLAELEQKLTSQGLSKLLGELRSKQVKLALPKFKVHYAVKLNEPLQALGMRDAFTQAADFSGINGSRSLSISAVLHKAFCEVNEEGTEAAAATAVVLKEAAAPVPEQPIDFTADHPFLYLIRDRHSGSILFMGRMSDPTK